MRGIVFASLLLTASSMIGCSEPVANSNSKPSPTGGAMFPLPGNKGFVAVSTESPEGPRGSRTKTHTTSIVASFFGPDGTSALSPAPTDVNVKIGVDGDAKAVPLPADAKNPNRFATAPGQYPEGFQGKIQAKIDGADVETEVSAR